MNTIYAIVLFVVGVAHAAVPLFMTLEKTEYGKPTFGYVTCQYRQSGYAAEPIRIRIVVDSMCPAYVRYDPVTGTWTR
jgi:hypothetical protein